MHTVCGKGAAVFMIIIRMSGGIGNQMFQYALYLKLVSMGKTVKFDDVTEYALENARPVMLSVFGIHYPKATREEVIQLTDGSMRFADRLRRRLTGRKSLEYQEASGNYDPEVFVKEDAYLCGCFQSERYFKDIENTVREAYRFRELPVPEQIKSQIEAYEKEITGGCSVSIHIRRGDYLDAQEVYGGICTDAYYDKAIACMKEWYPGIRFFIFTNDVFWAQKWCETKEEPERFTVIRGTSEETAPVDLLLMSKCSHHIIANSSFSWWGAWLGRTAVTQEDAPVREKRVVAPAKWLNTKECPDIYTEDMIRIDAFGKIKEK